MQYRSVRVLMPYGSEGLDRSKVDTALNEWSTAGWRLHSHSAISFLNMGNSSHEIVWMIFEKDDDNLG